LTTETQVNIRRVRVLGRVGSPSGTREHENEVAYFGRATAGHVAHLIRTSRIFAVTWGHTLSVIVEGFDSNQLKRAQEQGVMFIPVCAEPEEFAGSRESSSGIAERLNRLVKAESAERLALTRIPAFIPRGLPAELRAGIVHLIRSSASYARIFDAAPGEPPGPSALISKAEGLLTSVGHAEHPTGFNYAELLKLGDISAEELRNLVVGDIGGILIHRERADREIVNSLNEMWTGCRYETLASIAIRAARTRVPGVIVTSYGAHRAEILEAVIRRGLVNELILDETAALAVRGRLAQSLTA
jgi:DNA-binding transcriptional regulator LsrR (DeoR family)